jgi:integrase
VRGIILKYFKDVILLKKRSDGRYRKHVTLPDGKIKDVYGSSPAEVNAKTRALLKEADTGVDVDDDTRVGEWAKIWFEKYKSSLREHTIMSYKNSYNNHIREKLALLPLKSVRPVHVQDVMNDISDKSEDLQRKVLNTTRQMFDTAIQNRLMSMNPCAGIKITSHTSDKRIKVLSPEQQETLLQSISEPRARLFTAVGLYCGTRREETLGTMWGDIEGDRLTVNRAVTFLKNQQDPDHSLKSSAAHRTIPIPKPLSDILKATPHKSLYLITNADGGEMTLTAYRRLWKHVTDSVDFAVTSHMLRHSYCTSLYRGGVDLITAQYLMGHSDIKMTANIYTHIEKQQIDKAAKKIGSIFSKGSKKGQKRITAKQ